MNDLILYDIDRARKLYPYELDDWLIVDGYGYFIGYLVIGNFYNKHTKENRVFQVIGVKKPQFSPPFTKL